MGLSLLVNGTHVSKGIYDDQIAKGPRLSLVMAA